MIFCSGFTFEFYEYYSKAKLFVEPMKILKVRFDETNLILKGW